MSPGEHAAPERYPPVTMIGDRWGVTDAEVARRYPYDDVVSAPPAVTAWRGRGRMVAPLLCVGDLVMARRQPLTFARLAEAGPGHL